MQKDFIIAGTLSATGSYSFTCNMPFQPTHVEILSNGCYPGVAGDTPVFMWRSDFTRDASIIAVGSYQAYYDGATEIFGGPQPTYGGKYEVRDNLPGTTLNIYRTTLAGAQCTEPAAQFWMHLRFTKKNE